MDRTLCVIKPDAAGQLLESVVLAEIIGAGFRILALKRGRAPVEVWQKFYAEHRDRPFFGDLVDFMASAPVVVLALEWPFVLPYAGGAPYAYFKWRSMLGATDSRQAAGGTLRAKFGDKSGTAIYRNVAHGSDSALAAKYELSLWFTPAELSGTFGLGVATDAPD